MKKTLFLVFCATILCGLSASAQTAPPPAGFDGGMILPPGGGEWSVVIVVGDSKGNPIAGATVALPCSGQANKTTPASGNVTFQGAGVCPCTNAPVTVTTSSCDVQKNVTCGEQYNITCP